MMVFSRAAMTLALLIAGSACSAEDESKFAGGPVDHFQCAALIGAADKLMMTGAAPVDEDFRKRALLAGMSHLNGYAIPKNLQEKEAFELVNTERDKLIAGESPGTIVNGAKACL